MRAHLAMGVVAMLLVIADDAGAQGRSGQRPSPTGQHTTPAPSPSGQFRSRQTLRPRPPDPGRVQTPFRSGVLRDVRGGSFWWGWNIAALSSVIVLPLTQLADDAPTGGVQLDVTPWSSEVYVDGVYAGHVDDFRGYYQHLDIAAGPHVLAIVRPGYEPLVADIVIVPGRTLTYRATLAR